MSFIIIISIIAKLESGRILVDPEDLPWFLFDKYNSDDIDEGLLRGYFLIRVSLFLLQIFKYLLKFS